MTGLPYIRQIAESVIDPNEPGLISAWGMKRQGTIIADAVGSNNGTLDSALHNHYSAGGFGLRFGGAQYISIANDVSLQISSGSLTFSFLCRPSNVTGFRAILTKGNSLNDSNYHVRFSDGNVEFTFRDISDTTNVRLRTTNNVIKANKIYHVVFMITFGTGATSSKFFVNGVEQAITIVAGTGNELPLVNIDDALLLGRRGTPDSYFIGDIFYLKFFNTYKDAAWVSNEYKKIKNSAFWKTAYDVDLSAAPVTGGNLENTPFRVIDGPFQISDYAINGVAAKAIECISAGKIEIISGFYHDNYIDSIYGDYECWIEKAAGHTTKLGFINQRRDNTANGYGIQILTDGATTVEEWGVGTLISGGSLIPGILTKLNLKRRQSDDRLNGMINDVSFGNAVDSTITQSYYTIFECGAGDKIVLSDVNGNHAFIKRLLP